MTTPGCNKRFAGIRHIPEDDHLMSLAIAALMSGKAVSIVLNPGDIYFTNDGRCTVSRLSVSP